MILTIPLKPKVASRARVRSGQGGYNTKAYDEWLDTAAQYMAIEYRKFPLPWPSPGEAIRVDMLIGRHGFQVGLDLPWNPHHVEADIQRPKGLTGDLDNYVKAVLDALQRAGVIENDKQVVALSAAFITEGDTK